MKLIVDYFLSSIPSLNFKNNLLIFTFTPTLNFVYTIQAVDTLSVVKSQWLTSHMHTSQTLIEQDLPADFTGIDRLKNQFLKVLRKIHKEKEGERVKIDIWCHLGHVYIIKVDEGERKDSLFGGYCSQVVRLR